MILDFYSSDLKQLYQSGIIIDFKIVSTLNETSLTFLTKEGWFAQEDLKTNLPITYSKLNTALMLLAFVGFNLNS